MLFGLTKAQTMFEGYINKILAKKLDFFVIVYRDDILIYIKNEWKEYKEAVRWVLD